MCIKTFLGGSDLPKCICEFLDQTPFQNDVASFCEVGQNKHVSKVGQASPFFTLSLLSLSLLYSTQTNTIFLLYTDNAHTVETHYICILNY